MSGCRFGATRFGVPVLCALFALMPLTEVAANAATDKVLANIQLPPGFKLEVYTDQVPAARSMALGQNGTLFVGTRSGELYALVGDPVAKKPAAVKVIGRQMNMPNGVAFRDGALYVAEVNRILRYDAIESSLDKPPAPKVVRDDLPRDRHHGWKYIAFGPDGRLHGVVRARRPRRRRTRKPRSGLCRRRRGRLLRSPDCQASRRLGGRHGFS